jgi:sorting nexin-8
MTSNSTSGKAAAARTRPPTTGSRRKAPTSPRSVLDRQAFVAALENCGLLHESVTVRHVEGFYQCLHRTNYPPLPEFVKLYESSVAALTDTATAVASDAASPVPADNELPQSSPSTLRLGSGDSSGCISISRRAVSDPTRKIANRIQLPSALLRFLADPGCGFVTMTTRVAKSLASADGSTTKLVVELADSHKVEAVIMRYTNKARKNSSGYRASLCVSSQVGCAMGCTFCATGTMGLIGNLTSGEILEQLVHANKILRQDYEKKNFAKNSGNSALDTAIGRKENRNNNHDDEKFLVRNVVFMGMGEPLDNYANVVEACRAMIDRKRWNLAHGRVTVSTVGLVSKIRRLTTELPEVSLALSLHAPFQDMRSHIVPSAKNYTLDSLIEALDEHQLACQRMRNPLPEHATRKAPKRRAMIEYVMLEGPTSTLDCAHELGRLCRDRNITVNLIPYNPTDVKDRLRCPGSDHIQEFRAIVASYGTFCTVRRTMGADIDSACGQLVQQEHRRVRNGECFETSSVPRDMEDYYVATIASRTLLQSTRTAQHLSAWSHCTKNAEPTTVDADPDFKRKDDDVPRREQLIWYLKYATALAASSFVATTLLYLRQQSRRRR